MCGIAGVISPYNKFVQLQRLQQMADTLKHRGPDGEKYWINNDETVGFAHRRLRILDLSENAAQPFHYLHYTIIFNGEIYNYKELKYELSKHNYTFTTSCDTEVIPAAYDFWGADCLHHFDGMFAFALYDEKSKEIFIARDRFGEKPLYYYADFDKGKLKQFIFASEIKAIWEAGVQKEINQTMLLNFITLGYVQNPSDNTETFYKNIVNLPQSHYLIVSAHTNKIAVKKWYELKIQNLKINNENEVIEKFTELFFTSVKRRLRSDVHVGTSLSGGIDSSSILAAIDYFKQNNELSETWSNVAFTAVFPGFEKDEAANSKTIAEHFDIAQFITTPSAADCVNYFEQLMYYQDEPVQSSSVMVQFFVYALAKEKNITVLLDGQGADEILAGYKKYTHWYLQQLLRKNFSEFNHEKKLLVQNRFLETWNWKNYGATFFPAQTKKQLELKAYRIQKNNSFIRKDFLIQNFNKISLQKPVIKNLEDNLYYSTFQFGLAELLRYADRNSMAHSEEVRLPFLNYKLVEFIFSLPSSYKIKNGFTKWILRKAMNNYLPGQIVWQKNKIGYEPPQRQWMQSKPLQEMIMESRRKLVNQNILLKNILQQPVEAKPAHDAYNYDWRYLSAAALFAS
jgi:asparagine synthase (glutamine-hydrolysing)